MNLINCKMPECGNCSYDCCCTCFDPGCGMCKAFTMNVGVTKHRCVVRGGRSYRQKYVCFECRLGWKPSERNETGEPFDSTERRCPQCGNNAVKVSSNARCPSPKDIKGWQLFQKLQLGAGLVMREGYLSSLWTRGVGSAMHKMPYIKRAMAMPTHLRDYDAWVEHMNTTKIPEPPSL